MPPVVHPAAVRLTVRPEMVRGFRAFTERNSARDRVGGATRSPLALKARLVYPSIRCTRSSAG